MEVPCIQRLHSDSIILSTALGSFGRISGSCLLGICKLYVISWSWVSHVISGVLSLALSLSFFFFMEIRHVIHIVAHVSCT